MPHCRQRPKSMGLGVCGVIGPVAFDSGIATGGVPLVKYQPFLHLLWSYGDHLLVGYE